MTPPESVTVTLLPSSVFSSALNVELTRLKVFKSTFIAPEPVVTLIGAPVTESTIGETQQSSSTRVTFSVLTEEFQPAEELN